MKVVHVQLAYKGCEEIVLEELWQYLLGKPDLIRHYVRQTKPEKKWETVESGPTDNESFIVDLLSNARLTNEGVSIVRPSNKVVRRRISHHTKC